MGSLIRISLQHRITLLIGLTAAAAIAVFVHLGISAVDQTEDTAQRTQLSSTARAAAGLLLVLLAGYMAESTYQHLLLLLGVAFLGGIAHWATPSSAVSE